MIKKIDENEGLFMDILRDKINENIDWINKREDREKAAIVQKARSAMDIDYTSSPVNEVENKQEEESVDFRNSKKTD